MQKSVFVSISQFYNETFIEDMKNGKTWRIDDEGCIEYSISDWANEHIPPDLKLYQTKDGEPVFAIRQLLNLDNKNRTATSTETSRVRSIVTRRYDYEITEGDAVTKISAYWADGSMTSPSKYNKTPVAFELEILKGGKSTKKQSINIHMFFHGAEDIRVFEPIRGVFCHGLEVDSMFRDTIKSMTSLSFSSEFLISDNHDVLGVDAWMEPGNKLYRQDYVPRGELWVESPIKLIRIASLKQGQGTVYEMRERYGGENGCVVKSVNDVNFDVDTIVSPQNSHDIEALFGFNSTTYYKAGKVKEHGLVCELYHGLRNDWPAPNKDITTLWEWCIIDQKVPGATVKFDEAHFPLVSLNIYVTESPYNEQSDESYKGQKYTHNFYNLHSYPNNVLETNIFDITPCFKEEEMSVIQFLINTDETIHGTLKDEVTTVNFISAWKNAIYNASGLKPESLRLSKPILDFSSASNLTVRFHVMDRHENISESIEPIGLDQAVSNLQNAVKNNNLGVKYTSRSGKVYDLKVQDMSRRETVDPNETDVVNGYSGGTMAGIAIVMLLVGAATGAAIFILKKKYYDTPR